MDASHPDVGEHIRTEGTLPDEVEARLKEAVEAFKSRCRPSGERPAPKEKDADPMGEGEEGAGLRSSATGAPRGVRGRGRPGGRSQAESP